MTFYNKSSITFDELGEWLEKHKDDNFPLFLHFDKENMIDFKDRYKAFLKLYHLDYSIKEIMRIMKTDLEEMSKFILLKKANGTKNSR